MCLYMFRTFSNLIVMIYCVIVKCVYSWQALSASRNRLKQISKKWKNEDINSWRLCSYLIYNTVRCKRKSLLHAWSMCEASQMHPKISYWVITESIVHGQLSGMVLLYCGSLPQWEFGMVQIRQAVCNCFTIS